jgi:hypothetical protein
MYVGDMSNGYIEQPVSSNSAAAAAPPNQTGNTTFNFSFFFPRGVSLCFVIALVSSPQVHSPFLLLQVFFFYFICLKNGNRFDLYF